MVTRTLWVVVFSFALLFAGLAIPAHAIVAVGNGTLVACPTPSTNVTISGSQMPNCAIGATTPTPLPSGSTLQNLVCIEPIDCTPSAGPSPQVAPRATSTAGDANLVEAFPTPTTSPQAGSIYLNGALGTASAQQCSVLPTPSPAAVYITAHTSLTTFCLTPNAGDWKASPPQMAQWFFNNNLTMNNPVTLSAGTSNFIGGSIQVSDIGVLPPTPVPTCTPGGALGSHTLFLQTAYVGVNGTSAASGESASITCGANTLGQVTAPAPVAGAAEWNVYAGATTGTEQLQTNGTNLALSATWTEAVGGIAGTGSPPPFDYSAGIYKITAGLAGDTVSWFASPDPAQTSRPDSVLAFNGAAQMILSTNSSGKGLLGIGYGTFGTLTPSNCSITSGVVCSFTATNAGQYCFGGTNCIDYGKTTASLLTDSLPTVATSSKNRGQISCTLSGAVTTCTATATVSASSICTASYDNATTVTLADILPLRVSVSSTTLSVIGESNTALSSGTFTFDYLCL